LPPERGAGINVPMDKPLNPNSWEPPVLVWTVGKVASSSITATLRHHGMDALHVHYLSDRQVTRLVNYTYKGKELPPHLVTSLRFRHGYDRNLYQYPIKVVTMCRDPLARNLSAYFENLKAYGGTELLGAPAQVENFLQKYHHDVVLDWFDDELRAVARVDYRTLDFDPDKGWGIHSSERFQVLVLRAEEPDQVKLEALSTFLETPMTALIRENEASAKDYNDLYLAFKDKLALPQAYISHMYDNDVCSTFWNATEIRRMKSAWKMSEASAAPALGPGGNSTDAPYCGPVAPPPPPKIEQADPVALLENARALPEALPPGLRAALGPFCSDSATLGDVRAHWRIDFEGLERSAALRASFTAMRDVELPAMTVELYSSDGVLLCEFTPPKRRKALKTGSHSFTVNIALLPLNAGKYLPVFTMTEGADKAIVHRMPMRLLSLEDEPGAPNRGLLRAPSNWVEGPALASKIERTGPRA
jgi:Putative capsular polysaccharide synthesis protein